jgi:hypothetical protein
MSDLAGSIVDSLKIPDGGTIRRDLKVHDMGPDDKAHVSVSADIPMELAREIIEAGEERIDMRQRGVVGEAVVDLDDYTWELEIDD